MKRMKTFGELNPGDTFYKLEGLAFLHIKVLENNIIADGLSEILYEDARGMVSTEHFLEENVSLFPYYACIEKLESDLASSLKLTRTLLKEGVSC